MFYKGKKQRLLLFVACALLLTLPIYTVVYAEENTATPKLKDLLAIDSDSNPEPVKVDPEPTDPVVSSVPDKKVGPHDKYNRTTPYGSFKGLRKALISLDYELIKQYVDLRNLPKEIKSSDSDLLRHLRIVLARIPWIDINTLSDHPLGHKNDGLPAYRDLLVDIETPEGDVRLYLQRVPGNQGVAMVWKLSNHSVAQIPVLYRYYGYGKVGEQLSKKLPSYSFLGLEIWQWVLFFVVALASYIVAFITTRFISLVIRIRKGSVDEQLDKFIVGPLRFIIFILLARSQLDDIASSALAKAVFETRTLMVIIVAWLTLGLIDLIFGRLAERMKAAGNEHSVMLLRPARFILKMLIIIIAFISWLDNIGFSVSAMIAGLGVGGIAIGLAAQKSIENLIGAFTIYIAHPIRVGDFCRIGAHLGTIEEIGLRSTLLRTLDRSIVDIPNGTLASMNIENLTKREKILFKKIIRLRNDSTPTQVRSISENIREMLATHEDVHPVPARVRLTEYGEYSLNLELFSYIKTTDFDQYLSIVEDLNLKILDIVEAAGTKLAVPVRNIENNSQQLDISQT
ncbi:MAG: mechanosensitive ion channel family protein [Pseudomonadales bacterium]|nr:mechanosensitive ion channel family protein [Pseudomonadales bacterium]